MTNLVYLARSSQDVPSQRLMMAAAGDWHDAAYAIAAHGRAEEAKAKEEEEEKAKEAKAKEEEEAKRA